MDLIFKEPDKDNWEKCVDLKVPDDQKDYVAPNWYSIMQSKFEEDCFPLCIFDGEEMIGFLMYGIDPDTKRVELSRLMIDYKFQGKGYGKNSVLKLCEWIRLKYGNIQFYTSIEPQNESAKNLYVNLGFFPTGEIMWDEEVLVKQL